MSQSYQTLKQVHVVVVLLGSMVLNMSSGNLQHNIHRHIALLRHPNMRNISHHFLYSLVDRLTMFSSIVRALSSVAVPVALPQTSTFGLEKRFALGTASLGDSHWVDIMVRYLNNSRLHDHRARCVICVGSRKHERRVERYSCEACGWREQPIVESGG